MVGRIAFAVLGFIALTMLVSFAALPFIGGVIQQLNIH